VAVNTHTSRYGSSERWILSGGAEQIHLGSPHSIPKSPPGWMWGLWTGLASRLSLFCWDERPMPLQSKVG